MPQVPIYNQNQVGVSRTPTEYNKTNASADAFGVSGYDKVGQGLDTLSKALRLEQERMNRAVLIENRMALDKWEESALNDPDGGYLNKLNKDAMGKSGEILADFDKTVGEVSGSLKDQALKDRFFEIAQKKRSGISRKVLNHDINQTKKWRQDIHAQAIESEANKAMANRNNPDDLKTNIHDIKTLIRSYGEDNGEDPKVISSKIEKAVSIMHTNVLEAMLSEKNINAKEYFEEHKNELQEDVKIELLNKININDIDNKARFNADNIMTMGLSYEARLKEAQKIKNTDEYDATVDRLDEYERKNQYVKKQQYNKKLENAWDNFEKNPSINNIPSDLDFSDRISMKKYAKSLASGTKVKTIDEVYNKLFEMSLYSPDEFAAYDLNSIKGFLSKSDFRTIQNKQAKAGKSIADKLIEDEAERLGLNDDKTKEFNEIGEEIISEYKRQFKKIPNEDEIIKFAQIMGMGRGMLDGSVTLNDLKKGKKEKVNFIRDIIEESNLIQKEKGRELNKTEWKELIYKQSREKQTETRARIKLSLDKAANNKLESPENINFLNSIGYTIDDVKGTANKYGISEFEVLERLKEKRK